MHSQLSSILPASLTESGSHANTFNRSLVSSPSLSLPQTMLPDDNYNYLAELLAQRKSL